jgi:Na+-transporting methylmalonyl-CoA/oxaloacetate decarboxylase gamma subunit
MSVMSQSLIITAIGMGLVFILIALLWVFMAALVSATNRLDFMAQVEEGEGISEKTKTESVEKPDIDKPSLVAIAVATALAVGQNVFHISSIQPSASSSWQAVTRANTLSQISAIFNRKPRG